MILAGIDEAGLGPALGPLCVCCAALRVPDGWSAQEPWSALAGAVCAAGKRGETRLLVADSKLAHRAGGVAALERTALAFLLQLPECATLPEGREALLEALAAPLSLATLQRYPWYKDADWTVPAHAGGEEIAHGAAALAEALAAAGANAAELRASPVPAGELNAKFAAGLNKSEALLAETGAHLRHLVTHFPDETLEITVDKQGGRNAYLPFLFSLFPGAWIDTAAEGAELSEYLLRREGPPALIRFLPKADRDAFAVALASMLAKYLRERFMADLNAYFAARVPGLPPTAGYHGDAPRFLEAIGAELEKSGTDRSLLVRER